MNRAALFAERMRLVLAMGEANAAHHRAQARVGGAQIAALREGGTAEADVAAGATLAEAEARIASLEAEMDAVDRALEAAP